MKQLFIDSCKYMDKHFYTEADRAAAHKSWKDFGEKFAKVIADPGKAPHYLHNLLHHPDRLAVTNGLSPVMVNCQSSEKNNGEDKTTKFQHTRKDRRDIEVGGLTAKDATSLLELMAHRNRYEKRGNHVFS